MADTQDPPASAGGKIFGIHKYDPKICLGGSETRREKKRGYENKYEDDQMGDELAEEARVWRVMLDEGSKQDAKQFQGLRDHLDVDLVFDKSGLFAAVVTSFVVQSSQALRPDNAEISAALLVEMIAIQRAVAKGVPVDDVQPSKLGLGTVTASAVDYWVNRFWYLSLLLGLLAAFLAFIVRGWLYAFDSDVLGSSKRRALVRHYRLLGLERWNVSAIVLLLPSLLHASMLLFFIGLGLDLRLFDTSMSNFVIALTASFYCFYLWSACMPVLYPQCPYRSPLSTAACWMSSAIAWPCALVRARLVRAFSSVFYHLYGLAVARKIHWAHNSNVELSRRITSPSEHEWAALSKDIDSLIPNGLGRIIQTSSDPSVARVVVQATSGICFLPDTNTLQDLPYEPFLRNCIVPWLCTALETRPSIFDWAPGRENELERMACSLLLVPIRPPDSVTDDDVSGNVRVTAHLRTCILRVLHSLMSALQDLASRPTASGSDDTPYG